MHTCACIFLNFLSEIVWKFMKDTVLLSAFVTSGKQSVKALRKAGSDFI